MLVGALLWSWYGKNGWYGRNKTGGYNIKWLSNWNEEMRSEKKNFWNTPSTVGSNAREGTLRVHSSAHALWNVHTVSRQTDYHTDATVLYWLRKRTCCTNSTGLIICRWQRNEFHLGFYFFSVSVCREMSFLLRLPFLLFESRTNARACL